MQSGPGPAIAATASSGLLSALTRPSRPGRVIGVFRTAVYVLLPDEYVIAAVTTDAARLPNALVVADTAAHSPFAGIHADVPSVAGQQALVIGELRIRVARWHSAAPPMPGTAPVVHPGAVRSLADWLGNRVTQLPDAVRNELDAVKARLVAGQLSDAGSTAERLIGLGPGLTPTGDDVLAGLLIALHRLGRAPVATAFAAILLPTARIRTTALSATLLQHAALGESLPEVARLADTLAGFGDVTRAAGKLARFGHTSGHDLAHGVLTGAMVVSALPRTAPAATIEP